MPGLQHVAVTAIDGQSRTSDDVADRPLNVRYDQKIVGRDDGSSMNHYHLSAAAQQKMLRCDPTHMML